MWKESEIVVCQFQASLFCIWSLKHYITNPDDLADTDRQKLQTDLRTGIRHKHLFVLN